MALAVAEIYAQQAEHVLNWRVPQKRDYIVHNFRFQSGEVMPDMRLYYIALFEFASTNRSNENGYLI